MKFNRLWIVLFCFAFLLSACGKESDEKVTASNDQEELDPLKQTATEYVEPVEPELSEDEKFMEKYNLSLTGKEVQYDLVNNLNTDFFLSGTAELCDYYNYGYTNEKSYFCVQLTPLDRGYSDSWYLYFHRESFDSMYKSLLTTNVNMRLAAFIPKKGYIQGQGNMAVVRRYELIK